MRARSSIPLALVVLVACAVDAAGFEKPTTVAAADVLPAELRSGDGWKVRDEVKSDGFFNHFVLATDVCGDRAFCHPGISQAITAIGDWVFAGGMDGVMRVHEAATGELVWSHDASGAVLTVSGDEAHGGSFGGGAGPLASTGLLLMSAGYGIYSHMPGNVLLAFDAGE